MKKIFLFFAATLLSVSMWATNTYWINGQNGNLSNWTTFNEMQVSEDGLYEYFLAASGNCFCKIYTDNNWGGEMGDGFMTSGFNNTNIGVCAGGTSTDATYHNVQYTYNDADYYILIYYANTSINSTDKPIICASTILPNGVMPAVTYTVAGAEALCGSNWAPTDTVNDMAETTAGVYSITYSDIDLAATTYKFKVVKNHAWGCGSYPNDDYELIVTKSGTYDVTISFTVSSSAVAVDTTFKKAVVILPTINLGGEWYTNEKSEWLKGDAFVPAAGNETASTTIHFDTPADYGFKVIVNDSWQSKPKDEGGKNYRFHRGWTGDKGFSAVVEEAMILAVDKAGDYVFTWTYANDSLSIKYPELVNSAVTINAPAHVTIDVKNGEEAIGATVQELTQLTITATPAKGYRVKNLRAYLTAKTDSAIAITDGKLTMPGAALTITAEEGLANGYYLVGDFADVPAWGFADLTAEKILTVNPDNAAEYMIENVTLAVDDSLKIANVVDEAITWYAPNAANYVVDADHAGSNKTVYFRPAGDGDEKWWYNCIYVPANDPSAIDNTTVEGKAVKRIVNGQLIIMRDGKTFNALGSEIKK